MAGENAKIDSNYHKTLTGVAETSGEIRQVKLDETTDYMLVSGAVSTTPASAVVGGRKVVAITDTAVKLVATATTCVKVVIQALRGNTGDIVVGGADAVLTAGSEVGIVLPVYNSISIDIDDVSKIYINGAANDGVSFIYFS